MGSIRFKRWGFQPLAAGLLFALFTGCDNNSKTSGEEGNSDGFRISPSAVTFESSDTTAAYSAVGGAGPFSWSVSDGSLGSIPDTDARTVNYTRTAGRDGINTIRVTDASGNQATAMAVQQSLTVSPASGTLAGGSTSLTFTANGGSEPLTWSVTKGNLGTLSATRGRTVVYIRASMDGGTNLIRVRDAAGAQAEAVLLQEATPVP